MSSFAGKVSVYIATTDEVVFYVFLGLLMASGGVLAWISSKNIRVVTNQEGISATNFLGRTIFHVRWEELERMDNRPAQKDRYFALESGKKRLEIDSRYLDFEDLVDEIRERAPHISESYYD